MKHAVHFLVEGALYYESDTIFLLLFDIIVFESGTTGSRTNQAASFPSMSCR